VLGLSFTKLLLLVGLIIAIWRGYALYSRLAGHVPRPAARRRTSPATAEPKTVDLLECPRCGAYVDPRRRCDCLKS